MSTNTPSLTPTFPFARYISLLGVHTLLAVFIALYLPRTSWRNAPLPQQASSKDRPQHPFLAPLTADPSLTLTWLAVGAAVLQVWWGGYLRMWRREGGLRREEGLVGPVEGDSKGDTAKEGNDEVLQKIKSVENLQMKISVWKDALIATSVSSVVFSITIVLLGAPVSSHLSQTYLLALLLSIFTVYSPAYALGIPPLTSDANALRHRLLWTRLFGELSPRIPHERIIVYPSIGTILGSWFGAFPIALDWDRPWQAWPLTPAYGAILGYILASWIACLVNIFEYAVEVDKQQQTQAGLTDKSSQDAQSQITSKGSTKRKSSRR